MVKWWEVAFNMPKCKITKEMALLYIFFIAINAFISYKYEQYLEKQSVKKKVLRKQRMEFRRLKWTMLK